jgi:hypothetical protein
LARKAGNAWHPAVSGGRAAPAGRAASRYAVNAAGFAVAINSNVDYCTVSIGNDYKLCMLRRSIGAPSRIFDCFCIRA